MSNNIDFKKQVLERIKAGKISMRPKAFFVAKIISIAVLSIILLALSIFVLSFVFFSIHESGEQFLLGFGERGLMTFIILFPWWTLLLTIVFIFILEYLLHSFKFGYKIPILGIFLVILTVTAIAGVLFNLTPIHSNLLQSADKNELPIIGRIYEAVHDAHQEKGVYRGLVVSINGNKIVITHKDNDLDTDDGTWTIIAPSNFDMSSIKIGDKLYVAANTDSGGDIEAYGIQVVH